MIKAVVRSLDSALPHFNGIAPHFTGILMLTETGVVVLFGTCRSPPAVSDPTCTFSSTASASGASTTTEKYALTREEMMACSLIPMKRTDRLG